MSKTATTLLVLAILWAMTEESKKAVKDATTPPKTT